MAFAFLTPITPKVSSKLGRLHYVALLKRGTVCGIVRGLHISQLHLAKSKRLIDESKLPSRLALAHFDDLYKSVFGAKWPSIRLALLCPHKYLAVINPYVGETQDLKDLGAVNIKTYINENISNISLVNDEKKPLDQADLDVKLEDNEPEIEYSRYNVDAFMPVSQIQFQEEILSETSFNVLNQQLNAKKELEDQIKFPPAWQIFTFPKSDIRNFPSPVKYETGYLNYYLMDGSSIFPVWALDIQVGEDVADICASPGGKSLAMAYTMCPQSLFLIDVSSSRIKRLNNVLGCFLPDKSSLKTAIKVNLMDGRLVPSESFDKVLVDAPCTNDRVSVSVDDNNYFQGKRLKERLKLPALQCELLFSGLQAVKKGGSVVYSTCSLSPSQNDGVVHMALSKIMEETGMQFVVKDLRLTFDQITDLVSVDYSMNYGALILPYLPCNFGPMYVSKLTRIS